MNVLFGNGVENDHKLSEVATEHSYVLLVRLLTCAVDPAVNVSDFVGSDVRNRDNSLYEVQINVFLQLVDNFLLLLGFPLFLPFLFGGYLVLFLTFLCLTDVFQMLNSVVDMLHVRHTCVVNVSGNHCSGVLFEVFNVFHIGLGLLEDPGHDVLVHRDLLEIVAEEAQVLEEDEGVRLDVAQELFCNATADHLLVS